MTNFFAENNTKEGIKKVVLISAPQNKYLLNLLARKRKEFIAILLYDIGKDNLL